jgi:hypothetical protein
LIIADHETYASYFALSHTNTRALS